VVIFKPFVSKQVAEEFVKVGVIRLVIKSQSLDMVEIACECIREAMAKILN